MAHGRMAALLALALASVLALPGAGSAAPRGTNRALERVFEKVYRAHIRKEYLADPEVPKAPLLLLVGPSGSGKTATVSQAIEQVIFRNEVRPEVDLRRKKEEVLPDWLWLASPNHR